MSFAPFQRAIVSVCMFASLLLANGLDAASFSEQPPTQPHILDKVYPAQDLGVKCDNTQPVTDALQVAIDHVAKQGGGVLSLPPGIYLCGPIRLASHLDLHLEKGAMLRLLPLSPTYPKANNRYANLISGEHLTDVRISGEGTIDGQGAEWWRAYRAKELSNRRPQMIALANCERVELRDFTLINPPNTHISLRLCREVTLQGITLQAPDDSPNTDGINISGQNYLISGCRVSTGDDNIVILTHRTKDWPSPTCQNFVIRDCTLGFGHGLSIGSYTFGGIRNVLAEHITFDGTTSGIRLKAARDRGGLVENLVYRDITMRNVKNPVFISSYYPREPRHPEEDGAAPITENTPRWSKVLIENLNVTDSVNSIQLWGLPEMPVGKIILRNSSFDTKFGAKIYNAPDVTLDNVKITPQSGPSFDYWPKQDLQP